jgi:hypothetical protein
MPKLTMLNQPVCKEQEQEDRGEKAPVLLAARTGLILLLGRLGRVGRGYALAGAGVVAAAVVAVSLLSWLAPDSDRPTSSPLEAVGRVAGGMIEQVDDQVEALLGTDGEKTILRSLREGIAEASSAIPWPSSKPIEVADGPSTGPPGGSSSSEAPTRSGEPSSASEGAPTSQPASSTPSPSSSGTSEAPTPTTTEAPASSPTAAEPSTPPPSTEEPTPTAEEPPPTVEEPSPPPPAREELPTAEEPTPPPSAEEPLPATEEPPPAAEEPAPPPPTEEPPPPEGPPGAIAD